MDFFTRDTLPTVYTNDGPAERARTEIQFENIFISDTSTNSTGETVITNFYNFNDILKTDPTTKEIKWHNGILIDKKKFR